MARRFYFILLFLSSVPLPNQTMVGYILPFLFRIILHFHAGDQLLLAGANNQGKERESEPMIAHVWNGFEQKCFFSLLTLSASLHSSSISLYALVICCPSFTLTIYFFSFSFFWIWNMCLSLWDKATACGFGWNYETVRYMTNKSHG